MDFQESLEYLYQRLPIFQRVGKPALKPNLDNTIRLLSFLDDPHRKFKSVHVAGTNGKGTSCHALTSIMMSAGYKVGLYTSPHLKEFTERIRINGDEVDRQWVVGFVERIKPQIEEIHPSFFEVTVAMAFQYFAEEGVDIAVIETGLGGRLDSTNVITPEVSLITNIGMDHQDILGATMPEIASEKAGIIKEGVTVVIGEVQQEVIKVFRQVAAERGSTINERTGSYQMLESSIEDNQRFARFDRAGDIVGIRTDLLPEYFLRNVPGLLEVVAELRRRRWNIDSEHVTKGLATIVSQTGIKGRFQCLGKDPQVIADISHNVDGMEALMAQVSKLRYRQLHVIYGAVQDKQIAEVLDLFPTTTRFYLTETSVPRAMPLATLAKIARKVGLEATYHPHANAAMKTALRNAQFDDLVLITGSTFVVAEIDEL